MKNLFLLLILISAPVWLYSQSPGAEIVFSRPKYKFGFVREGQIVTFSYEFINKGSEPLLITDSKAECSCTNVSYPTTPIKPGEKGIITVSFDTTDKRDRQDRIIEIISNAKNSPSFLRFKGVVLKRN